MRWGVQVALASSVLLHGAWAADTLSVDGFQNCNNGSSTIQVQKVDISFDKATSVVTFDVAGSSSVEQKVTAEMVVSAYGIQVYSTSFDPCADATKVEQLCPVPQGNFAASGQQPIPSDYLSQIPSIAFTLPDIDATAQMVLKGEDGTQVGCVESGISNGKTVDVPAVSYVAAAIAGAALLLSLASAGLAGAHPGSSSSSPGFMEVMGWFQGLAMNGMFSVNYPTIYRSFTKNFAFSTGLISWGQLQTSIDNFRKSTGGNLTDDSYAYLKNATLVFPDGTQSSTTGNFGRRSLDLFVRQSLTTTINGTTSGNATNTTTTQGQSKLVSGIEGYVEQLTIPQANTFMTVLLIFAIIVAVIVVGILLFKVILEAWAIWGTFPKSLSTFRKEYWRVMAQTIVSLILLLYGIWTLYCIFQFTHGDSWAAKLLAGLTLGIFTVLLFFYSWRIIFVARKMKKLEGDAHALYNNKDTWKKYRIFYENYKTQYWWLFIPFIVYMFAKGCVLAAADGHGMAQTIGQLAIEAVMLFLLLWSRPYTRKSGNWINIIIQVVRVISVVCILVFVEELGISKTTQTITGVVLIAVQASLTVVLAILIAVNSIITCVKENPHRRRRKAAEKAANNDLEGDAFLMTPPKYTDKFHQKDMSETSIEYEQMRSDALARFGPRDQSGEHLVSSAASMGKGGYRSLSQGRSEFDGSPPPVHREPTLPNVSFERFRPQLPH